MRFDNAYYSGVIREYGYDPLDFRNITFRLGAMSAAGARARWLCHHCGASFARAAAQGAPAIVTTGIGLSGPPHLGTVSQILRAIALQRAGLRVQLVLGDLDSYAARGQPLALMRERVLQYERFIVALGFDPAAGTLRDQEHHLEVLLTSYLSSPVLRDRDFTLAIEDLADLYQHAGVHDGMDMPLKAAIMLMLADFLHLGMVDGYSHVLVMLGLEEHRYVRLARTVAARMKLPVHIAGLYSRVLRGLHGYPKMSKSFPDSYIGMGTPPSVICDIVLGSARTAPTDDASILDMMHAVSDYSCDTLAVATQECEEGGSAWRLRKDEYLAYLIALRQLWPADITG